MKHTWLATVAATIALVAMAGWTWAESPEHPVQHATPAITNAPSTPHAQDAAHGEADHGQGNHEQGSLLPDPASNQTWYNALWVIIIFAVMLAILYPTAWKGVLAGLKAREERIRRDIADAEATRARAEQTLKDYNTQLAGAEERVRQMLAKAQADGETLAANIRVRSQQEAEQIKEKAQRDIEAATQQAIQEIYRQAADLATAAAEKILRRNLNVEDQRELVNQSLRQLENANKN